MSFFSNPLAEEDEVVPPDYPLEQYDERKREDDFNELLVRSTKLEAAQHSSGDAAGIAHPDLLQCLQQNQEIRTALEERWNDMSHHDKKSGRSLPSSSSHAPLLLPSHHAASILNRALDAGIARLQAQAAQHENGNGYLNRAVERAAHISVDNEPSLVTSPTASAYTVLRIATVASSAHPSTVQTSSATTELPALEMEEVIDAVQALETQLPCMSAEEAALATAAVQHLFYGLRSWASLAQRHARLRQSVAAKTLEQKEALLAAQTVARWTAARQLIGKQQAEQRAASTKDTASSDSSATPAAPPLSFDLALAESLSKELNAENRRLEAVLARLLSRQQGAPHTSLAGSALVQYVSLIDHARALEQEVERLGCSVLYLRAALADPASVNLHELTCTPPPPLTSATEEGMLTSAVRETVWASRLTHLNALELSLRSPPAERAGHYSAANSADEILLHGLTKLLELYDACLHAVALLSTYFEKQSANAAFLVHAMRGGGPLEDTTVERILDVPLPDAASVRQAVEDVAATSAEVKRDLAEAVQKSAAACVATRARWESVRSLLAHLLRETLSASAPLSDVGGGNDGKELAALLAAYEGNDTPSLTAEAPVAGYVRAEPSWEAALQEEVGAFKEEKAEQRKQAREYWLNQQTESRKKLTWLMKQPNAPLLVQLCDAEKEKGALTQQLKLASSASANAAELQHTLDNLQRQVTEETIHNVKLQEELDELQTRKRALESERASLIESLS
ncbi:hypothetical protein ABL78_3187 [Leptomonas seymouri]|uniref:Uncharacterized protein n=1 Tax=Leptomonas seymouri TaxID=5684 RepID=A0A0N1I841_LEPSE|nr:hypothetical protein ABL78_3187 [Leptomonas seymouri]|eukprot:KPI87714.1 hypothetical protein ABL78_3187 [Leptomonas seymouri]